MFARLIDVRVQNFTSEDTNEEVKGYRTSFIIPSRHPEKYAPTIVSFYTCEDDRRGHSRVFKEVLDGAEYKTSLDGLGNFNLGYLYLSDKKLQSLTYLDKMDEQH